jgi:hypothetical protein|tara:strand:- start:4605 stop:4820 length:216 start_codon:yes stop_codon:yes gene_type:complete
MVDLKQLDRRICAIMKTTNILSWQNLYQQLEEYHDYGVRWYVKEKYEDYKDMKKKRHRYSDPNWQLKPTCD